jgi:hypothetical protein
MSEQNKFMVGVLSILALIIGVFWWYNQTKIQVAGLDCETNTCTDKKGNVIPLSRCTELGLIC